MSTELKQTFWKRMDDVTAGLLSAAGERPVPMAPHADKDAEVIWFVCPRGSAADRAAHGGDVATFQVADPKANLFANLDGKLSIVDDSDKLDELWDATVAAWFPDGRDDDSIRLISFSPDDGEIWATAKSMGFLYEVAKANVTKDTPDAGQHGRVAF